MIQTFLISGMTCLSCKANVEHTLNNFDDVNEASVDFDKKELTVNSNKDIVNKFVYSNNSKINFINTYKFTYRIFIFFKKF